MHDSVMMSWLCLFLGYVFNVAAYFASIVCNTGHASNHFDTKHRLCVCGVCCCFFSTEKDHIVGKKEYNYAEERTMFKFNVL